ncbi:MAG TPA: zinc ribbon domain-containing protein [Gemmatimonadaceae bacterium]|nr:zinc ribbon domain-containing protein [Gemmatimonadaceae bacterium]
MIPLVIGTVLALAALAVVLYPLFAHSGELPVRRAVAPAVEQGEENAVEVLREIEFDRATGKLSDADYAALRARYTERALAELRARDSAAALAALPVEDAAEAEVRRQRARLAECPTCGPRPEPDALYCSDCGRFLPGRCGACGAPAEQPGMRFCSACGHTLAA